MYSISEKIDDDRPIYNIVDNKYSNIVISIVGNIQLACINFRYSVRIKAYLK
jgi:hypothetical protein